MSRVGGSFVGPSTVLEKGFILLLSFVMLFLGAVVIGEIASNITAANLRNANFTKKLRSLHGFFRSKHVPLPLQKRIIRAMNARWTSTAEDETGTVCSCCGGRAASGALILTTLRCAHRVAGSEP